MAEPPHGAEYRSVRERRSYKYRTRGCALQASDSAMERAGRRYRIVTIRVAMPLFARVGSTAMTCSSYVPASGAVSVVSY